ncbi:MAG TPA: MaoC family dehydratase [Acidimicrobiales bacterium]|nr:MaoC family dehydratase [Acidimicrobiales bacterium]
MAPRVLKLGELSDLEGAHLGFSSWHTVTQEQVDQFADATGDHQWIHLDPDRAKQGPFGTSVAHGFLTLSMLPVLLEEIVAVESTSSVVNYGLNRARFPAPVPVGSQLRVGVVLEGHEELQGAHQLTFNCTFELAGSAKPPCVATIIFRYYVERPEVVAGVAGRAASSATNPAPAVARTTPATGAKK